MGIKLSSFKGMKDLIQNTVSTVAVINLILAATALFKDIFLAFYLGTSVQADALLLAYFIPDTAGNNLLASALGVACVPVFSRLYVTGEQLRLNRAVAGSIIYFGALSFILMIIFYLAGNTVVSTLGAGLEEGVRGLCVELLILILPSMAVFPVISIGMAVMQVHNRFNIPALAPVLFNLVFLSAILYVHLVSLPLDKGVYLLAASVLAGAVSMAALTWLAITVYRIGVPARPRLAWLIRPGDDIVKIFKIFFPYLAILFTFQAVLAVERYLASGLEVGSIAGLNYAYRMAQFPLWVFVAAVSAVAFPSMSKATGLGQMTDLKGTVGKSISLVFIITVPLAVCLFVLRVPVVSILLQRGSFDSGSVQVTAGILAGYALSVVFQGLVVISLRAFLAVGRYEVPLLATLFSAGLNIVLDFVLVDVAGSAGLGYGAAAGALVNAVVSLFLLNRELGLEMGKRLGSTARILAANLPVLLVAGVFHEIWCLVEGAGLIIRLGYVFGVVAMGLPVYLVSLRLLKVTVGGAGHGQGRLSGNHSRI